MITQIQLLKNIFIRKNTHKMIFINKKHKKTLSINLYPWIITRDILLFILLKLFLKKILIT